MNRIRGNFIFVWAILAFASSTYIPSMGWAQSSASGQFTLSRDVRWDDAILPVGEYVYYIDSSRQPSVVRVERKGGGFSEEFRAQSFLSRGNPANGGIVLTNSGADRYVSSLVLPSLGRELFFTDPSARQEGAGQQASSPGNDATSPVQTSEYLTILNPNHERVSAETAEKVYLRAFEAVEKEFNRSIPSRPKLTVRLGASTNILRYPTEVMLKKWDEYRFADAIVDLALYDMVTREERARLSGAAVSTAESTVSVCELKACTN